MIIIIVLTVPCSKVIISYKLSKFSFLYHFSRVSFSVVVEHFIFNRETKTNVFQNTHPAQTYTINKLICLPWMVQNVQLEVPNKSNSWTTWNDIQLTIRESKETIYHLPYMTSCRNKEVLVYNTPLFMELFMYITRLLKSKHLPYKVIGCNSDVILYISGR